MTPLIIGIGNSVRGDDAAGLRVVEAIGLSETVLEHDGEPASLVALWEGQDQVVLIDAVTSGGRAGIVIEIDGPTEAVELARVLGKLPPKTTLLGIEGRDYSFGAGMSQEVEAAVKDVVRRVRPATEAGRPSRKALSSTSR